MMTYLIVCGAIVNVIFGLGLLFGIICTIKIHIEDYIEERRLEKYGTTGDGYWKERCQEDQVAKGEIGRDLGHP